MINKQKFLIVDGYGFIFRAYYVQPKLSSPAGIPVGAIYGFTSMMLKLLNDFSNLKYGVVVFDTGGKNFRHQIYPEYKAHRPPVPEDLIPQFPLVRIAASSLNFPTIERDGFEADDVIATLALQAQKQNLEPIIVSSDKDLMQLVSDDIKLYDPIKAKYITTEDVIKKFGVPPKNVRDILALMGDKSDNIPGVSGVGPKTALELIKQFENFHNIIENPKQIQNLRIRNQIINSKDKALISFALTALDCAVDIPKDFTQFALTSPDVNVLSQFLAEYGFKSLIKRAENLFNIKLLNHNTPPQKQSITPSELINIIKQEELEVLYKKAQDIGIIALYLLQLPRSHQIIIFSLQNQCYYIDLKENDKEPEAKDLFSYGKTKSNNLPWMLPQIIALVRDPAIKKITYGLKNLLKFLPSKFLRENEYTAIEDLELMTYTISAGLEQKSLFEKYDPNLPVIEIINKVALVVNGFEDKYNQLTSELLKNEVLHLYKDIDLPLCYLLHKIEQEGIKIELSQLKSLSEEFGTQIQIIEQKIHEIAGSEFNIASPKQLGEILFNKMQLPYAKNSTKSANFSTSADILEKLKNAGYEIADILLTWRSLTKLKTTYTDALPQYVNNANGRIHTTFLQTSTTTGRLSSQEPNLQNIPIRTQEGNKIRAAFIAKENYKLISADYSQIELRILSAIASIKPLQEAFEQNIDIHSATAMKVFDLHKEQLTAEHRRKAKAINFGIIYGISPFGLAKQLNITNTEAADYIDRYFKEFPGIKEYMEETKLYAAKHGYVKNMLGRKCYIPYINDKNYTLRQVGERAAINAPIQGMNAEIIKIAMLNIDKQIQERGLNAKIILQIHDELLLEIQEKEVNIVMPLIKNIMENAYRLSTPLVVEVRAGNNWLEIH